MKFNIPFLFALASIPQVVQGLPAQDPHSDIESEVQTGFHIDPSLPNGRYNIHMHDNGTTRAVKRWEPHTKRWHHLEKRGGSGEFTFHYDENEDKVESLDFDSWGKSKVPLPISEISCDTFRKYDTLQKDLIEDDYEASKQALFHWCNLYKFVEAHIELALHGNVAVWVCQRKYRALKPNFCSQVEYEAAEKEFDKKCGRRTAWVYMGKWVKEYGRGWKGEHACRNWGDIRHVGHDLGIGPSEINRPYQ